MKMCVSVRNMVTLDIEMWGLELVTSTYLMTTCLWILDTHLLITCSKRLKVALFENIKTVVNFLNLKNKTDDDLNLTFNRCAF